MKIVAFVPIKLKSERLKSKNILDVNGKPLAWHIFNTLLQVTEIDEIYVFCSNEEILNYIPKGIKFLKRDEILDGNLVKGEDIYKSFTSMIDADVYVLAHTTSPFLKAKSISNSLNNILEGNFDSAFSAKKEQTFAWYNGKPLNYELNNIPRTQDITPIFIETSGFYAFKKNVWKVEHRRIGENPYIQEVDYLESIDIDEPEDYEFVKSLEK